MEYCVRGMQNADNTATSVINFEFAIVSPRNLTCFGWVWLLFNFRENAFCRSDSSVIFFSLSDCWPHRTQFYILTSSNLCFMGIWVHNELLIGDKKNHNLLASSNSMQKNWKQNAILNSIILMVYRNRR